MRPNVAQTLFCYKLRRHYNFKALFNFDLSNSRSVRFGKMQTLPQSDLYVLEAAHKDPLEYSTTPPL